MLVFPNAVGALLLQPPRKNTEEAEISTCLPQSMNNQSLRLTGFLELSKWSVEIRDRVYLHLSLIVKYQTIYFILYKVSFQTCENSSPFPPKASLFQATFQVLSISSKNIFIVSKFTYSLAIIVLYIWSSPVF